MTKDWSLKAAAAFNAAGCLVTFAGVTHSTFNLVVFVVNLTLLAVNPLWPQIYWRHKLRVKACDLMRTARVAYKCGNADALRYCNKKLREFINDPRL